MFWWHTNLILCFCWESWHLLNVVQAGRVSCKSMCLTQYLRWFNKQSTVRNYTVHWCRKPQVNNYEKNGYIYSFYPTQPLFAFSSLGKNTHWYTDMQNTAISKRQGKCVLNPSSSIGGWEQILTPLMIIPKTCSLIIYQPRQPSENQSVCILTAKHTANVYW